MWAGNSKVRKSASVDKFDTGKKVDPRRKSDTAKTIASRDMSLKKRIIKKVAEHCSDGKAEVTAVWNVDLLGRPTRISFSRDNLGVWINGCGVVTSAYISDHGYDVDLFFDVCNCKGHIYSDVEGNEMMNYLVLDEELVGFEHKDYSSHLVKK